MSVSMSASMSVLLVLTHTLSQLNSSVLVNTSPTAVVPNLFPGKAK